MPAVERDEVPGPVDRIGYDRGGGKAVFRLADILHIAVQPLGGRGLLVLGQPLLELRDAREQHPVLTPQREVVAYACKESVHAADHLVGT